MNTKRIFLYVLTKKNFNLFQEKKGDDSGLYVTNIPWVFFKRSLPKNKIVVGYMGDARASRGFNLLPELIHKVFKKTNDNSSFREIELPGFDLYYMVARSEKATSEMIESFISEKQRLGERSFNEIKSKYNDAFKLVRSSLQNKSHQIVTHFSLVSSSLQSRYTRVDGTMHESEKLKSN